MSTGIYIATGQSMEKIDDKNYIPINVGKTHIDGMLSDKPGDSIANKNPYYCEMTALYWIWKNRELEDYVGLCHYRRFFDLTTKNPQWLTEQYSYLSQIEDKISTKSLDSVFQQYDIILPYKIMLSPDVITQYDKCHRIEDFVVMSKVIEENYPSYIAALNKVKQSMFLSPYNMFITKRRIFQDYMEWVFSILFEVEKRIDIPYEDTYQRRVFGFLAERLFNVYVEHQKLKVLERPVIFLDYGNTDDRRAEVKDWKYTWKRRYPFLFKKYYGLRH